MNDADLDYDLPDDRIAQQPLAERDAARLLVVRRDRGTLEHRGVRDLPELLAPGDLLVRNVSRVIPARLRGRRRSGGRVELLLVRALAPDRYLAMARPAARLRDGERVRLDHASRAREAAEAGSVEPAAIDVPVEVEVRRCAAPADAGTLSGGDGGSGLPGTMVEVHAPDLAAIARRLGETPLPPYIRRAAVAADRDRYQTVYARDPGSVAAPTAGLHFTPELLAACRERGIATADVTLHVGPGTFLPVRPGELDRHVMHAEEYEVPAATAVAVHAARSANSRVIAVGTTAVRALESAAAASAPRGGPGASRGETRLFLRPGLPLRVVTSLLTNFHQPRTTLLALVAAFTGLELLQEAYAVALRERYRFLSYGDAMLVL